MGEGGIDEIVEGDTVLAHCFSIAPRGFVVVPILKELPPIKAYSEECGLDVDQREGLPQLVREVLLHRIRQYARIYSSLDAVQPKSGDVLLGREHKAEWNRFLKSEQEFKDDLTQGKFQSLTEVGPLLTTSWHQSIPYKNFCPIGYGDGRCVVGCVATAAAQIMKYWNWPPYGTGSHSYEWDGDNSCNGPVGGGTLNATFSDPYDWGNILDDYGGGYTQEQADAVAELCYEVGVAFEMDYGVCGSGTWTYMALTVFPDYFRYSPSIDKKDRSDHTAATWFSIIQNEINNGRPMQYRIYSHSIVCDGWRDTYGQNQYHINYGWDDSHTTWYTIDNIYCPWEGCDPSEEYLIRYIMPEVESPITVKPDGTGDLSSIRVAISAASDGDTILLTDGTFTGEGNRDIDFQGKSVTVLSQSGDPNSCTIDCEGSWTDQHRGFYFHSGEGSGSVLEGVTISNGYIEGFSQEEGSGAGIYCTNSSSPTIINCIFSNSYANYYGGGVFCDDYSSPTFTNCTFYGNSAVDGGGIFCNSYSSPTLENSIIAFTTQGKAGECDGTSSLSLTCCDIYGNQGGDWVGCIADQYEFNGNFSMNPFFCDPDNGEYHLLDNSPCAPAQQPECGLIGALGVGCDQLPPVTMPITETGTDIPFTSGWDTLAILNFLSEELDSLTIDVYKGGLPPNIPEGTKWVHTYYSIIPFPEEGNFEATMTLFYTQIEFDASGLSDESEIGLCKYDSSESTWTFEGGIVDPEGNSITLSGVTQFSVWGITDSVNIYPAMRGDPNRDRVIDIGDVVYLINYLYKNGLAPVPLWAGDANCDEIVDIGDVVYLINYLYREGPAPSC